MCQYSITVRACGIVNSHDYPKLMGTQKILFTVLERGTETLWYGMEIKVL